MNARIARGAGYDMSPGFEHFCAKYGAITIGILFGTSAKYALVLAEGRKLTLRMLAVDTLLIGIVVLVASYVVRRLGVDGETASLVAALLAVSSDRVIRLIRERFIRRVDAEMHSLAIERLGEVRQVVQTELSGKSVIDDTLSGNAPPEYTALKTKRPD